MAPSRKNKRSLEEMVRKLSEEKKIQLETEMNRTMPLPINNNNNNLMFPLARLMHPPFLPPNMYLANNFLRSPFAYFLQNLELSQFLTSDFRQTELSSSGSQTPEDAEVKIDDGRASSSSNGIGDISSGANENDGDKKFVCPHIACYKRFSQKALLKKHQFIHTGLRPHQCLYCKKRFNRKDNLIRHSKTHRKVDNSSSNYESTGNAQGIDNSRFHLELVRLANSTSFMKTKIEET
ncbi:unnamed protein product [Caenorhabditis angaria]|uniref:C2H2-type domain-containing protein n=1 Tax=Caenorhabditis angaria TaxID=860376 RepID=A0A9P1MW59_9PELO|nr:unnamed protein product [Caenorhabditis angaria]